MSKIKLPLLNWLVSEENGHYATNIYSGSVGTDPEKGCLGTRTFNYRAYVKIVGEKKKHLFLIVIAFIIGPWVGGCEVTDYECKMFKCTERGKRKAEKWLSNKSEKYGF
ncbi:MAG: hypothetical protein IKJ91_04425 [Clostridia bacterium]|nr:hypothetical protein [Clostridia bacterium]